ncbi:MAG TPA: nuclear transport factor 2 family protein [Chitinophagaceae bacterium]|nr:nuclear transport factor 2 family protein [Chitinophagaceae bacterium]
MKRNIFYSFTLILLIVSCSSTKNNKNTLPEPYQPVDKKLYDTIVYLDSVLFDGYNTCKLDRFERYFSDSIEFYHDKGGLSNSKKQLIESLRNNICGKVTRELIPGSIEVYPIPGYGAVQIGNHRFHNNQEPPGTPSRVGKFVHTWQYKNGEWKISRVISLH